MRERARVMQTKGKLNFPLFFSSSNERLMSEWKSNWIANFRTYKKEDWELPKNRLSSPTAHFVSFLYFLSGWALPLIFIYNSLECNFLIWIAIWESPSCWFLFPLLIMLMMDFLIEFGISRYEMWTWNRKFFIGYWTKISFSNFLP